MSKKQKITLVSVFAVVLVLFFIVAGFLNQRQTEIGTKHFQLEIISDRDGYSKITEYKSKEEFLGQFLRSLKSCEWKDADYGIYVTGFDGMSEDPDEQYWWYFTVNHEASSLGADLVPLKEGELYTFTLKQGW